MEFFREFFESAEIPVDLPSELQEFIYEMAPYGHSIKFSFPSSKKRAPGQFVMTGGEIRGLLQKFYNDAGYVLRDAKLDAEYRRQLYDYIKYYQELFNEFLSDASNLNKSFVIHTSPSGMRYTEMSNKQFPISGS